MGEKPRQFRCARDGRWGRRVKPGIARELAQHGIDQPCFGRAEQPLCLRNRMVDNLRVLPGFGRRRPCLQQFKAGDEQHRAQTCPRPPRNHGPKKGLQSPEMPHGPKQQMLTASPLRPLVHRRDSFRRIDRQRRCNPLLLRRRCTTAADRHVPSDLLDQAIQPRALSQPAFEQRDRTDPRVARRLNRQGPHFRNVKIHSLTIHPNLASTYRFTPSKSPL